MRAVVKGLGHSVHESPDSDAEDVYMLHAAGVGGEKLEQVWRTETKTTDAQVSFEVIFRVVNVNDAGDFHIF